ncbi:hypothetical protein EVAR_25394_1 [Eumeta japonica]|uniref:Uncharacterized protein n=1 Tax=Eumeta variegata TaxID=151549 RepID=A0A4C1V4P9_EUMVA|nr:hypothetical protein EVAR_25394_1 [Eumeta japonica]
MHHTVLLYAAPTQKVLRVVSHIKTTAPASQRKSTSPFANSSAPRTKRLDKPGGMRHVTVTPYQCRVFTDRRRKDTKFYRQTNVYTLRAKLTACQHFYDKCKQPVTPFGAAAAAGFRK